MNKKSWAKMVARDFNKNKWKYVLILPIIIYLLLFHYKTMYGLIISFQNYKPYLGYAHSEFVGLLQFKRIFADPYFARSFRNTLVISLLTLIFAFPAPILLALILNEVKRSGFKRTVQTVTYQPHFIASVVVCGLVSSFCQINGIITDLVVFFGGERQNLLMNKDFFYPIYIISEIWQNIGWDSIIYLAALSSIEQEQYEAARIDGAGRFAQIVNITLPGLLPTVSMLLILRMGSLLSVGYEKILLLYQPSTYEVADVLSTYVYRKGIIDGSFSFSAALGFFNSIINIILLVSANKISKRVGQSGLF